jgi:hypothetical protein
MRGRRLASIDVQLRLANRRHLGPVFVMQPLNVFATTGFKAVPMLAYRRPQRLLPRSSLRTRVPLRVAAISRHVWRSANATYPLSRPSIARLPKAKGQHLRAAGGSGDGVRARRYANMASREAGVCASRLCCRGSCRLSFWPCCPPCPTYPINLRERLWTGNDIEGPKSLLSKAFLGQRRTGVDAFFVPSQQQQVQ